jgi:hypothetical protein
MKHSARAFLSQPVVRTALKQAWFDSQPGAADRHEEGGFFVADSTGYLKIVRWPRGGPDAIDVPTHVGCKIGEDEIVASFHTHPNTGQDYLQEPGETDQRAVRDDPGLRGENYVGEFVVSREVIYLITPQGQVREIEETSEVLLGSEEA